jgi:hypothetical protein
MMAQFRQALNSPNNDGTTYSLHFWKEKVHSATLIYIRWLSFNPQPQNQVLHTHKLSKPSNLSPSVDFEVVFAYVAPRQGGFCKRGATPAKLMIPRQQAGPSHHSPLLLPRRPCVDGLAPLCRRPPLPARWPCRCPFVCVGGPSPAPVPARLGPHTGGQAGAPLLVPVASSTSRLHAFGRPPLIRRLERGKAER